MGRLMLTQSCEEHSLEQKVWIKQLFARFLGFVLPVVHQSALKVFCWFQTQLLSHESKCCFSFIYLFSDFFFLRMWRPNWFFHPYFVCQEEWFLARHFHKSSLTLQGSQWLCCWTGAVSEGLWWSVWVCLHPQLVHSALCLVSISFHRSHW